MNKTKTKTKPPDIIRTNHYLYRLTFTLALASKVIYFQVAEAGDRFDWQELQ